MNSELKETGEQLIIQERERQISKEGWTIEHDDQHIYGELAKAADCYYEYAEDNDYTDKKVHQYWPWDKSWWKPKDQLRDYIRAGALYRAEKERLERTGGAVGQKLTNLRIGTRQCEIRIDEILKCEEYCRKKQLNSQQLTKDQIAKKYGYTSYSQAVRMLKYDDIKAIDDELKDRPSPSGGIKTAEEIAKEIFYLPATNGQAEASIAKGAELIRQYGNQFAGDGWISLDDEIPPENKEVLVINKYGRIRQASWMEYTGQNKVWFEINFTHWMELPSPPQNTKES